MYLANLTLRLAEGLARASDERRSLHADYLLAAQRSDGGFAGREGESDLYYTSFGLRGLALLGRLQGEPAWRAAGFLQSRLNGNVPVVDFLTLIYSAKMLEMAAGIDVFAAQGAGWQQAVSAALEPLRRGDGGYAKTAEGQASSVYHSFLVVLCRQLIERPTPQPERLVEFVRARRREDGGFVEMNAMNRSGTNPTAAAIGLLSIFEELDDDTRAGACAFLAGMQTDEGGLRANTRIPIADLLSTFTGMLTVADLGASGAIDAAAAQRYVAALQRDEGGFRGAEWDPAHDVEYTFYGLGAMALVANDA